MGQIVPNWYGQIPWDSVTRPFTDNRQLNLSSNKGETVYDMLHVLLYNFKIYAETKMKMHVALGYKDLGHFPQQSAYRISLPLAGWVYLWTEVHISHGVIIFVL